MRRTKEPNRTRPGFSLIELLAVVGILILLMAILMPSLGRAREQARDTQCLSRIRQLFIAHTQYIHENRVLPPLNDDADDGTWQYNYLIFDGKDYHNNFGPLIDASYEVDSIEQLFCPVQTDPFHTPNTEENPWPAKRPRKVRSGYARRYHLSGRSLAQFRRTRAFATDVFHVPDLIASGHGRGVNVVYTDGHASWVNDGQKMINKGTDDAPIWEKGHFFLSESDLGRPFDLEDNPEVAKIWRKLDDGGIGNPGASHGGSSGQTGN